MGPQISPKAAANGLNAGQAKHHGSHENADESRRLVDFAPVIALAAQTTRAAVRLGIVVLASQKFCSTAGAAAHTLGPAKSSIKLLEKLSEKAARELVREKCHALFLLG